VTLALLRRPDQAGTTRVAEIGVCGTDREISEGLFGIAPEGGELVLGHELLELAFRPITEPSWG
jgi:hypothetical protein